jgi:hypothetical protein
MHRPRLWGLLLLLAGCEAHISGAPGEQGLIDAGPGVDGAAIDAAAVLGPWSTPVKILPASSTTLNEDDVTLSSNALEMIFAIDSGTSSGKDLYYSSRASTSASTPWSTAVKLSINSAVSDETPRFSADNQTLYFASARAGNGNLDIYSVPHPTPDAMSWGTPQLVPSVNTATLLEKWYMPCGNQYFMVQETASSGTDLVTGTLGSTSKPTPVADLNSAQNETGTYLSPDCLTIYFASTRPTSTSPSMIYKSTRPSVTAPWAPPTPMTDFKMLGGSQEDPWLSPDDHTFVFVSDVAGTKDVYISTR